MDQNGVNKVPSYVPSYVQLGRKAIIYLSMALEIPMASKFGNPQAFHPQASRNLGATICGQLDYLALLNKHIGEPRNPAHTYQNQPPSLDGGR